MNVTRFDPWGLVNLLQRDLDQFSGRRFGLTAGDDTGNSVADYIPAVDIIEETDCFILRADLAGVDAKDIQINMENGVLSLSGERHAERTENSGGMHRIERPSGKFYRRFTLPETADAEKISAKSANGILEVRIPKQQKPRTRRITIESA